MLENFKNGLVLVLLLMFSPVTFGQVEMSGMKLGDNLLKSSLKDTIQGINVAIVPVSEDGIICGLTVFPVNEKGLKSVWSSQADMICVYFEERYGIVFNKKYSFIYNDAYTGIAEKDGIMYILEVQIADEFDEEYTSDPSVFVWFNILNQNNVTSIEERH